MAGKDPGIEQADAMAVFDQVKYGNPGVVTIEQVTPHSAVELLRTNSTCCLAVEQGTFLTFLHGGESG